MRIAVTGATGFLGRYVVAHLTGLGHRCVCWHRPTSDLGGIDTRGGAVVWVEGSLGDPAAAADLVRGCDAVVHAALDIPGQGFRGAEGGDVAGFAETNVVGSLRLIEAARRAGAGRFVFVSTGAVHDQVLGDRPLDEDHPARPATHYGASKAAVEAFVHSYGAGGYPVCALRPTGIYGLAHPPARSKWFGLVRDVAAGKDVTCDRGGKEVHAADVARAAALLLTADARLVAGGAFECYDLYVADHDVAAIARDLSGSRATVRGTAPVPRHQIVTDKIRGLGMTFGGRPLLERTVKELLGAAGRPG